MQQKENISPWLEQLDTSYSLPSLQCDIQDCDVAIVGAGIAGISTAFYLLRYTQKKIVLIEGGKVAHGATGHNAGQVVSYFERPFSTIVKEYGVKKAVAAQRDILNTWQLLQELAEYAGVEKKLEVFTGYAVLSSFEQLLHHLENKLLRDQNNVGFDTIYIDKNWSEIEKIPEKYHGLITFVSKKYIQERAESKVYFPILLSSQKGCVNSALLSQKVVQKLLLEHSDRLRVFENTQISTIKIYNDLVELSSSSASLVSNDVVLCTNGYEHIQLIDKKNKDSTLNTLFHKHVEGLVGYMAGFYTHSNTSAAISYFVPELNGSDGDASYFYLTRRKTDRAGNSLVVIGGPELFLADTNEYRVDSHNPAQAFSDIKSFVNKYRQDSEPYAFRWHGLMGFTKTRLRYIGNTSQHPHIWYNLGCNGVGILSSIFGGWKIAQRLNGAVFDSSVFDPVEL